MDPIFRSSKKTECLLSSSGGAAFVTGNITEAWSAILIKSHSFRVEGLEVKNMSRGAQ